MKRSIAFALSTLLALPVFAGDAGKAPAEPDGMVSLFDGKDLTGWDGDSRLWSVKDGVMHGETTDEVKANGNTFLIWKDGSVKDFELRLSFRCSASNNSGIQYRSKHITDDKNRNDWVVKGYQHEIRNENTLPNVSGFIYDEGGLTGGRGRTCLVGEKAEWTDKGKQVTGTLITADEYSKLFKVDEWNDVIIVAKGRHIQHYMNGRLVLDFQDAEKNALHAGKPMWTEFKNIRVKHFE
jgi:hypothetical protein